MLENGQKEKMAVLTKPPQLLRLPPGIATSAHDLIVFEAARIAYVRQAARAVKPGGHVIVSTFGPEGPTKCGGLDVVRYDAESLH